MSKAAALVLVRTWHITHRDEIPDSGIRHAVSNCSYALAYSSLTVNLIFACDI